MAAALIRAARRTGIHLTLVPVYYRTGDFDAPALPEQRRFVFPDVEAYLGLREAAEQLVKDDPRVLVGYGVHSMRAASADEIKSVFRHAGTAPCHIHIAEQTKEVEACKAKRGRRPVAWLLENTALSSNHHLVHATHMNHEETSALAASGATAVLCPSTEGNLGDGFFPFQDYVHAGGRWAIGSDSHIGLSPMEELRWIDYGQRLRLERRNVLGRRSGDNSGQIAFHQSWIGGRRAMGLQANAYFAVGDFFDAAVIDAAHPLIRETPPEHRLSTLIYAGDNRVLMDTIAAGMSIASSSFA
jgi:formimidoylglutamate deiminase